MLRGRGMHILDNFPCFFTTAHTDADIAAVVEAFKEAVREMQEAGSSAASAKESDRGQLDANQPPVPGARLGRDADGKPAWFVPNPERARQVHEVGTDSTDGGQQADDARPISIRSLATRSSARADDRAAARDLARGEAGAGGSLAYNEAVAIRLAGRSMSNACAPRSGSWSSGTRRCARRSAPTAR